LLQTRHIKKAILRAAPRSVAAGGEFAPESRKIPDGKEKAVYTLIILSSQTV